jgi:hypothetical protein
MISTLSSRRIYPPRDGLADGGRDAQHAHDPNEDLNPSIPVTFSSPPGLCLSQSARLPSTAGRNEMMCSDIVDNLSLDIGPTAANS